MIACRGCARASSGSSRTPTSDAISARVTDARGGNGAILRGQLRQRGGGRAIARSRCRALRPGRSPARARTRASAPTTSPWLSRMAPIGRQRSRIAGSRARRPCDNARGLRRSGRPSARRSARSRYRNADRAMRRSPVDRSPVPRPNGAHRPPPWRGQHVLHRAEPQHVDAAAQFGQRRILRERGFEARQRLGIAIELEQHLAAADQCRHIRRVACRARSNRVAASFSLPRATDR